MNLSIQSLPVELLYRIFDNLDTETIIFSIRPLSRLFQSVVNTYDRYVLDSKLISKSNFCVLCRLIDPKNINSFVLSNNKEISNQIDVFISLVHLQQFTRIQFLTLHYIEEFQLNCILKRMNLNSLVSFSFNIRKYDNKCKKTTLSLLSSVVAQLTLRKLEIDIESLRMDEITWPVDCKIQHLTINSDIHINSFCTILQFFPHLHTFIIRKMSSNLIDDLTSIYFPQLRSLTIKDLVVKIDKMESLLLLTPSLVYLKLIGGNEMLDGKRWEQFIQINLVQLEKFEFYFNEKFLIKTALTDVESIISLFQTPFWMEYKKWFVSCEYLIDHSTICLYSEPICLSILKYTTKSQKISLSTSTSIFDNNSTITDNINSLNLCLSKIIVDEIQQKTITNHPMFPKVTEIELIFQKECPLLLLQSLSIYINISQLVKIKLYTYFFDGYRQNIFYKYNKNIPMDIGIFMEQAHNLSSLIIQGNGLRYNLNRTIENIHSTIPCRVKHLQVPTNSVDQIKRILERCQHLSTLQLDVQYIGNIDEMIEWFSNNTINSTCWKRYRTIIVWLGIKQIQSTEINVDYKRIKLTDDNSNF
ncbi:hypothetical protein I4U23_005561 [Adineta vaga]|nr:hypothetical protein I4U23_005561 [Adineta vaga]